MVFVPEKDVRRAAVKNGLPIVKSKCPADGNTSRQKMKEFLYQLDKENDGLKFRVFGAMRRAGIDGWGYSDGKDRRE